VFFRVVPRDQFTWERRPMRRKPASVSALWLFLLSRMARRNGLLSLRLRLRRKRPISIADR
jgi:hypothetical protein